MNPLAQHGVSQCLSGGGLWHWNAGFSRQKSPKSQGLPVNSSAGPHGSLPANAGAPSSLRPYPVSGLSRRDFILRTGLASAGFAVAGESGFLSQAAEALALRIAIFTKVYQPLKLSFAESAAITAEAGLDGVDIPVRPDGEIRPERVAEDLPVYAAELRKRNLGMPLVTTAITSTASPNTEALLRSAKDAGAKFYRLGFIYREPDNSWDKQLSEIRAQLKDLAALNKQIGIGAIMQNHSPSGRTYVGGNLDELWKIVGEFDPSQIGVAFDIGHSWVVHGDGWRSRFEKLKSHLKIVYVKDVTRAGQWVKFGEGDIAGTGYFKLLEQIGYHAPISMHIEYEWSPKGQPETRDGLLKVLKENLTVLKDWLTER
jgi:sugar phosphate isomerase/epimerase